ncbi:hypothetical protein BVRB_001940 [Beta vulgaris subsp. vulgaris]|uniref:Uncharacterized protein n=1 Tax=Beta vulgaris subsp. vulgaris TaxID=3555 RepID=A0A0J8B845_BETVV|nr:hypothetical protein BVRB_001940 [Beta vulgaris subsp. vulgaris]
MIVNFPEDEYSPRSEEGGGRREEGGSKRNWGERREKMSVIWVVCGGRQVGGEGGGHTVWIPCG